MVKKIKLLVLGHSHIECLQTALSETGMRDVVVFNLHEWRKKKHLRWMPTKGLLPRHLKSLDPEAVCLCVGGNEHNTHGLIENPIPFDVAHASDPNTQQRHEERCFIPAGVMRAVYAKAAKTHLIEQLYARYPRAKRYYMSPPPPIADWQHIAKYPGAFRKQLHLGAAPKAVRMALFKTQQDVFRQIAASNDAVFVDPPSAAVDPDGFLKSDFFHIDPTHANARYGELMIAALFDSIEGKS